MNSFFQIVIPLIVFVGLLIITSQIKSKREEVNLKKLVENKDLTGLINALKIPTDGDLSAQTLDSLTKLGADEMLIKSLLKKVRVDKLEPLDNTSNAENLVCWNCETNPARRYKISVDRGNGIDNSRTYEVQCCVDCKDKLEDIVSFRGLPTAINIQLDSLHKRETHYSDKWVDRVVHALHQLGQIRAKQIEIFLVDQAFEGYNNSDWEVRMRRGVAEALDNIGGNLGINMLIDVASRKNYIPMRHDSEPKFKREATETLSFMIRDRRAFAALEKMGESKATLARMQDESKGIPINEYGYCALCGGRYREVSRKQVEREGRNSLLSYSTYTEILCKCENCSDTKTI